jgi:hypothetical protein
MFEALTPASKSRDNTMPAQLIRAGFSTLILSWDFYCHLRRSHFVFKLSSFTLVSSSFYCHLRPLLFIFELSSFAAGGGPASVVVIVAAAA